MTETNEPNEPNEPTEPTESRIGNDYSQGPNPQPGGDIDLSGSAVPPYDDRSTGSEETAAGVPRAMGSEEPLEEPIQPGADGPDETDMSDTPPKGTGESIGRRGEDAGGGGTEPGRERTGDDDGESRPHGESTPRDLTSINPHQDDEGGLT
jgi:hypothetical protein